MPALSKKLEAHVAALQYTIFGYALIRARLASGNSHLLAEDIRSKSVDYYDGIIFQAEQSLSSLLMAYNLYSGFKAYRCLDQLCKTEYSFNHYYGDAHTLIESEGQLVVWERA